MATDEDAASELERLRSENERLRQQLAGETGQGASPDESSAVRQVKYRNVELFNRLASQKAATKAAQDESAKRDKQICVLTMHVEKVMSALKNEGNAKREARAKLAEAEALTKSLRDELAQLRSSSRSSKSRTDSGSGREHLLEKQLQVLDAKYQNLYRTHQQVKTHAQKSRKTHESQIEQISSWVWRTNQHVSDLVTARTNTFLGALKMYESVFGNMTCSILDFQECELGDAGIKALSRTLQATVARQNQLRDAEQQQQAKRFDAWHESGGQGPLPGSAAPPAVTSKGCVLNVAFNNISDRGLKHLAVALAKCHNITEVDLRGNRLTKKSIPFLADLLMYNSKIVAVDASGNAFSKYDLASYIDRFAAQAAEDPAAARSAVDIGEMTLSDSGSDSDYDSEESDSADEEGHDEEAKDAIGAGQQGGRTAPRKTRGSGDVGEDVPGAAKLRQNGDILVKPGPMPILAADDKVEYSMFLYEERPRPNSAPPRVYTTGGERDPDTSLPRHGFHSSKESTTLHTVKASDILRKISQARLFPPQRDPFSAMARISLDSISRKSAQISGRRLMPRPESALISRNGGQELPKLAMSLTRKATGGAAGPLTGPNVTTKGKIKFKPTKLRERLQVEGESGPAGSAGSAGGLRPSTAPGGPSSPGASIRSPARDASPSASLFSPHSLRSPKQLKKQLLKKHLLRETSGAARRATVSDTAASTLAASMSGHSGTAGQRYAPQAYQNAFVFARKGNVVGILNLMKRMEPGVLLTLPPHEPFHPNMRQAKTGETVIMHATRAGRRRVVEIMLEKGADLDLLSNEGWSALHHAVDARQPEMVELLVQLGHDVNLGAQERDGTALHLAIRIGNLEAICKLLECPRVDINARDQKGRTPMHLAVLTGAAHLARLFRDHKANVRAADRKGRTPIHYAEARNDVAMQELLMC